MKLFRRNRDPKPLHIRSGYYTRERLRKPPPHRAPLLMRRLAPAQKPHIVAWDLGVGESRTVWTVQGADGRVEILDIPEFLQPKPDPVLRNFLRGSKR